MTSVVYLVDDDLGISTALSLFLGRRGMQVRQHRSGQAFLDHYEAQDSACVVIDVRLPDMTGFEALDQLAEEGHEPPAIVITGHGPPPVLFQKRQRPVEKILLKPFEPDDLLALIRKHAHA